MRRHKIKLKTITMLEFRQNAQSVLRRIAKGERFLLLHRGKHAARLEPLTTTPDNTAANDPFLSIGSRATASPKGKTRHREIDRIVYGRS
jgi:antitoxin (DNA-binding transcriptional repressor) of toxin-antitoxin stability system